MTSHGRYLMLAATAIDAELSEREQDALARHLAGCAACRRDERVLRSDAIALRDRPRRRAPAGMRGRFERDWLPQAGRRGGTDLRLVLVLAAAIGLGMVAFAGGGARIATSDLTPQPSAIGSATSPGPRTIGPARVIPLEAGPDVDGRTCTRAPELGCAADVVGAFASVWTTATDRVVRMESDSGRIAAQIRVQGHPMRIAADERFLWVAVRGPASIVRIDPATNTIERVIPLSGLPAGIAIGSGSTWVADEGGRVVWRLAPEDGRVLATIPTPVAPWSVAATGAQVWVTGRLATELVTIDPSRNVVSVTRVIPGAGSENAWDWGSGVTTDGARTFVGSGSLLSRFDAGSGGFTSVVTPMFARVALFQDRVWVLGATSRVLQELDAASLQTWGSQSIVMTPSVGGEWEVPITVTGHAVWIRSYEDNAVIRIDRTGG